MSVPLNSHGSIGWPWTAGPSSAESTDGNSGDVPSVTLAMPSYNQDHFLEAAIQSVIRQNYPDLEFVVRDGGSTDGSVDIIRRYDDAVTDWVSQPDGGQTAAINSVWEQASGELFGWLNSDDILAPGALHSLAQAAQEHPEAVLFFGDCGIIDEAGEKVGVKRMERMDAEALLKGKSFGQPSVFIRQEVVDRVGLLDASLTYAMDWSYFLKVLWAYSDSRIRYVPEVLSCSREYEGTKSRTGLDDKGNERRQKLREYVDMGVIPSRVLSQGLAGTYWIQGANEFLVGHYLDAFRSGLKAIQLHPSSLFEKLPRLIWLFQERFKRPE